MIHALPEAEIIESFIIPYKKEAAAFPLWMVTDLESKDTFTNLFLRLQMTLFEQIEQHCVLILQAPNVENKVLSKTQVES